MRKKSDGLADPSLFFLLHQTLCRPLQNRQACFRVKHHSPEIAALRPTPHSPMQEAMKIFVESQGDSAAHEELKQKIQAALELLESEAAPENRENIVRFARILQANTPSSYLESPAARQLADWVGGFYRFIAERKTETAVEILPFGDKGHSLLLTNSPDANYLVDSLQTYLSRKKLRFFMVAHPILKVRRKKGGIAHLADLEGEGSRESFIVIELEGVAEALFADLVAGIFEFYSETLQAHRDFKEMNHHLKELAALKVFNPYEDFLRWLQSGNFMPFGYRSLLVAKNRQASFDVQLEEGATLGLSLDTGEMNCVEPCLIEQFPQAFQDRVLRQGQVVVEEIDRPSPVHRGDRLIYLGLREPLGEGRWKEHVFLGLFPQKIDDELTSNVPALRRRLEKALSALHIPKDSHDYRKTVEIFNTFPKVELFFMDQQELVQTVRSFTLLYRQGAVKVVAARSLAVRGLTLLLIMPREFYSTEYTLRLETYLCRFFQSPTAKSRIIHISSEYMSLHVSVQPAKSELHFDLERLERGLTNVARPWRARFRMLLEREYGDETCRALEEKYQAGFSREYRTLVHPRFAIRDVKCIEQVLSTGQEVANLWGPFREQEEFYRLQFYSPRKSYLNELMPLLENLNIWVIDEVDFSITLEGNEVFIKSFSIRGGEGANKLSELSGRLLEALMALRRGEAENDYLNRLLLLTSLSWREIDVFRGYRNYYFQLGSPYSKKRVAYALINNPQVAELLFRYFRARFQVNPEWHDALEREEKALSPLRMEMVQALESVSDINEDSILRTLFNLIDSTVRTNFFLRQQRSEYFFSFKISALGIIEMPAPRPMYEIYVHSAEMEGIHLRGGKVARGGLRWSDRPDDFRTEILGLMKTQMTKNALIVPVGSKGGFVVKTPFTTREQGGALSKAAYQTLIRGLLDLTDNRRGEQVIRPEGVVAYDEEDPYLVVAADKGTAHLPDTANAVSAEYGFWLDDAFASGGSFGYDHKKLGITARGAWECVKRHFREMGADIQSEPFTVAGIGDMSGDVFGNGMLLSRKIRLLAAFDHRHVFLDPDPDPETSFVERKRLFDLPRSSWDDYNRSLISEGGGVFPRHSKDIPLSPQVRQWLGVRHESMDGQGLIRLILCSAVDLLWNGGIGTYVKASTEKNEDAGDRSNDGVRIDSYQLKAKVIGEGGNLGLTQKARIEYALAGGRINTDAVDNSAGVDCSDHEVNLKIFMGMLLEKKVLGSLDERNSRLEEVTDEVCAKVLANSYTQGMCLSLDTSRCEQNVDPFLDLADRLGSAGLMDRRGEFLPTAKEVRARKAKSLTRPELSILMAYSKMQIYQALLESDLPDQPGVLDELMSYFPTAVRERFGNHIASHPLAREITATVITNKVVDLAGSSFANNLSRRFGATLIQTVGGYLTFDRLVGGQGLRQKIFELDNRIPTGLQYSLLQRLEDTLTSLCSWALDHDLEIRPDPDITQGYAEQLLTYEKHLGAILPEPEWRQCKAFAASLTNKGFSKDVAHKLAALPFLEDFLPIVSLVQQTSGDLHSVAKVFNEIRDQLGAKELLQWLDEVPVRDRWDRMALQAARNGFAAAAFKLAGAVLQGADGNPETYFAAHRQQLKFYLRLREGLSATTPANYHPFTVLIHALEGLLP